ncbi:hypothetical protein ILYODFUR_036558 [Ilyodon furcidens]|uniref:UBZ4-type domain-containing protein n=1 Tax=Ilyodon furcidens TaxID=33524 RepID=A0ABV0V932_9TELE
MSDYQRPNSQIPCPICGQTFSQNEVEAHASECSESNASLLPSKEKICLSSLDDILQAITAAVKTDEEFPITISRSNMVERGLAQWKRQKRHCLPIS